MKILRLIAEVRFTEKEAKGLLKTRELVWDTSTPIATVGGKDIKFVSASLVDEGVDNFNLKTIDKF